MLLLSVQSAGAATITVTNLADGGTLRSAISDAAPGDTIDFSVTGTIALSSGQLTIDKDLIIQGPGVSLLAITRVSGDVRIFDVTAGTLLISDVTIQGGSTGYGTGSDATEKPGGGIRIAAGAAVTAVGCAVSGNSVHAARGQSFYIVRGGGVFNAGTFIADRCTFSGNRTYWDGFAGDTGSFGGALFNNSGAQAAITNSTFSGNSALGSDSGSSPGDAVGGAICNEGTLTVENSTVSGNQARGGSSGTATGGDALGGGIYNSGMLSIASSTIVRNRAVSGTGIGNGLATGGGLAGPASVVNSVIAENTSDSNNPSTGGPDDCSGTITSQGLQPH